jgi:phosphatidylglycerophosphate synthase
MKNHPVFDEKKALYSKNPVWIYSKIDPYTVKIAKFVYNLGLSANNVTAINLIIGLSAIAILFLVPNYTGLMLSALLIILRNIGDTIDGKIARGSGRTSSLGGFLDIISDWVIFHAAFFISLGILTNHIIIGFLCVTGYMSREFTRRIFEKMHGEKITETKESKKISWIVSIVKKYDLATVFFFTPLFLLFNQLTLLIYLVMIIEYVLLFGEFIFDFRILLKDKKELESKQKI